MSCLQGDDPEALRFGARAIEHVRADYDCCKKPGDSLRFVPVDRSIEPVYKE